MTHGRRITARYNSLINSGWTVMYDSTGRVMMPPDASPDVEIDGAESIIMNGYSLTEVDGMSGADLNALIREGS